MAFSKQAPDNSERGTTHATTADLELQVQELRRDIADLAKTIASIGSGKIDEYKSGVDRVAADAVDASVRAFERARSEALSLEESFEQQVRAHPLQALGIAAGVGFLFALFTRRS